MMCANDDTYMYPYTLIAHLNTLIKILAHGRPILPNTAYTLITILNICQPIPLLLPIPLFGS